MMKFTINVGVVAIAGLLAVGCGGGSTEPLPAEGDVSLGLDATATDAAAVVDDVVAQTESATDMVGDGWQDLQSNWQDSIGSVKDRWADLTEEELLSVNGDREELVSLVQEKYGLDRESAELEVANWASTL